MSENEADPPIAALSDAAAFEAQAAAWLEHKGFGDWSRADQAGLDAWLAENWLHRVAYWRLEAAWDRTERLTVLRRENAAPATRRRRRFTFALGSAAAVFIACALAAAIPFLTMQPPPARTYATAIGGHKILTLADGTRIELNTDTVLRIGNDAKTRKVWLEKGEAYFAVKHDSAHPFVVIVGNHRVTDLGTKFTIRRRPGELDVALLEGRLQFGATSGPTAHQPLVLTPGEQVAVKAGSIFVSSRSPAALTKALKWRHGLIVFDNTKLGDAAAEFNRYNTHKIVIADRAAAEMTIGGTFRTEDVQAFADVAKDVLGLHIENHANETIISR